MTTTLNWDHKQSGDKWILSQAQTGFSLLTFRPLCGGPHSEETQHKAITVKCVAKKKGQGSPLSNNQKREEKQSLFIGEALVIYLERHPTELNENKFQKNTHFGEILERYVVLSVFFQGRKMFASVKNFLLSLLSISIDQC